MTWTDEIRALLLPVAFDRDPRDGLERVLAQQFGAAVPPERLASCVAAIDTALASSDPLTSIMPSSHADADVRAYLEAVRTRLAARLAPPSEVAAAPATIAGCEQLLDVCANVEVLTVDERNALLDEIEAWTVAQLGRLDEMDMDALPAGRDLVIQGLGMLLDGCSVVRNGEVAGAVAATREAERLIRMGESPLDIDAD